MGRVSCSQAALDVVVVAASTWILATTTFKWILAATSSCRPSRPEFQHYSPTFRLWILAASAMGTSSWRATPAMGNASVDDTDTIGVATFFFTTDGKSFIPTFNYSIHNMSKCQTSRVLIHFYLQASFIIGWTRIRRRGPKHGRVW
jgi:hypothetical protein